MLFEALLAARDLPRIHAIATVFVRHGFGELIRRVGIDVALRKAGRILHVQSLEKLSQEPSEIRFCRALEELGPTFVKLGQLLSTRVDLFPPEWITAFERLQDEATPVPFEQLRPRIEEDLAAPIDDVFSQFDETPLAGASLAQVHAATLRDGGEVVVKIRRPGITQVIEADLRLLTRLAEILERELPDAAVYRPRHLVRRLAKSLRRELDFARECHLAERVARHFRGSDIVIPRVHWAHTGVRMNVQERIRGIPGRDRAAIDEAGLDRSRLARRLARAMMKMVLVDGLFHADPHAGNLFFLDGDRVAMIDFGLTGHLSHRRRDELVRLAHALLTGDDAAADVLMTWTDHGNVDPDAIAIDVDAVIDDYYGLPLDRIDVGAVLGDLTQVLRDHHLHLPDDLALLVKAMIILSGVGRRLDPDFDAIRIANPFLRRASLARLHPRRALRRARRTAADSLELAASLPREVRGLVRSARRGTLRMHLEVDTLAAFGQRIDRAASRLTVGLVTAALIIATAIGMTVSGQPELLGLPVFGGLGAVLGIVCTVWLVRSLRRSTR